MNAQERTKVELAKVAVSAAAKLGLFLEGQMELTEEHADALISTLIELIEEARDESWRFRKDG